MAEMASLEEFLEKEVPEWGDDDFARARFKAFTGQRQDWEERLSFWKDLILKVARHLDVLVIDTQSVEQKWFIRGGVVPMGLRHVLVEMRKSGELGTMNHVLGGRPSNFQLVGNLVRKAFAWASHFVLNDNYAHTKPFVEEVLVVVPVLQERTLRFLKVLADSHFSSVCIATLAKIQEICGGAQDAELVIGCLLLQNKAQFMSINGSDHMEGFKISLNEKQVGSASESDHHVLRLHCTMEILQSRLSTLEGRIAMAHNGVVKSIKAGDKKGALRYVRNMKLLQISKQQCTSYMDKIDQVLGIIADAETSKKVSDAMQVATAAIKENHVSLEEVHQTLNELDEAITLQQESEVALAGVPLSTVGVFDEDALDEELTLLEEELKPGNLSLPNVPQVPVVVDQKMKASLLQGAEYKSQISEGKLQEEFAKLALELG